MVNELIATQIAVKLPRFTLSHHWPFLTDWPLEQVTDISFPWKNDFSWSEPR